MKFGLENIKYRLVSIFDLAEFDFAVKISVGMATHSCKIIEERPQKNERFKSACKLYDVKGALYFLLMLNSIILIKITLQILSG